MTVSDEKPLAPPLKWAGGKRWLIPILKPMYELHRDKRLVEPFTGGLAVSLGLNPAKALLNDTNVHLVNFYQHVRAGLKITSAMKNEREFFFSERQRFNDLIKNGKSNTKEAAVLFYYMNRTAFNGLCRFNSKGEFNVPFGKYNKINYSIDFSHFAARFEKWDFSQGDFEKLKIEKNDFLYVDPPYDVEFTKYSKEDFTWNDQVRLVKWLLNFKCPVIASNQATDRIISLYSDAGFHIEKVSAPRMISCNGNRQRAWEILATKNIEKLPTCFS